MCAGHVAKDCRSESRGQGNQQGQKDNGLQRVQSSTETRGRSDTSSLADALYSSDDSDVWLSNMLARLWNAVSTDGQLVTSKTRYCQSRC